MFYQNSSKYVVKSTNQIPNNECQLSNELNRWIFLESRTICSGVKNWKTLLTKNMWIFLVNLKSRLVGWDSSLKCLFNAFLLPYSIIVKILQIIRIRPSNLANQSSFLEKRLGLGICYRAISRFSLHFLIS